MKLLSILSRTSKSQARRAQAAAAVASQSGAARKPHDDLLRDAIAATPDTWLDDYFRRRIGRAFPS